MEVKGGWKSTAQAGRGGAHGGTLGKPIRLGAAGATFVAYEVELPGDTMVVVVRRADGIGACLL